MSARQGRERGARAAVVPFPTPPGGVAAVLRLLPSGRSLAAGLAIVVAVVLAYAGARYSPMFALDRVEVRGAPPQLAAQIKRALTPLGGESLLAFRTGQADDRLARIPEVASASYDRDFPHTLRLTVQAERPLAVVRRGDGAWLVAASGRVLAPMRIGRLGPLPRIWLPKATDVQVGVTLADLHARAAVRSLVPLRRVDFPARVRFVRASEKELTLVLASGVELRLGDLDRLRLKLAVAARILPRVETPAQGAPYLDLTVPERPVASSSAAANPQVAG
jgi:cell division protein FtsQ